MNKLKGSMAAASSLQVTDIAPYIDAASKELLVNREFLALILKYTVPEYADMELQEIVDCIEPDSISKSADAAPARTNANRIAGSNTEHSVLNEKLSKFDVLFNLQSKSHAS